MKKTPGEFEHRIEIAPAFDKRDADPNKNYGIGAMRIWFLVVRDSRAVQFVMSTGIYPRHLWDKNRPPEGWDVGYHAPKPLYEGQTSRGECEYIGGPCYYDGSSLRAEEEGWVDTLLNEGSEGIFKRLETEWMERFGTKAPPSPEPGKEPRRSK